MKIYKKNIYTQTEYAKKIGVSQPRINQMIKENNTPNGTRIIVIQGAELIEEKR